MQKRLLNSAFIVSLIWLGLRFLFICIMPLALVLVMKYSPHNLEVIEQIKRYSILPIFAMISFIVGYLYSYDTEQSLTHIMSFKIIFFIIMSELLYRINSFTYYTRIIFVKFLRYFDNNYTLFSSKEIFDAIFFYGSLALCAYIFLLAGSKCYRYFHKEKVINK